MWRPKQPIQTEWSLKIKKNGCFFLNNKRWCKNTKRLTETQVLTKKFTKRVFKKMKVTVI